MLTNFILYNTENQEFTTSEKTIEPKELENYNQIFRAFFESHLSKEQSNEIEYYFITKRKPIPIKNYQGLDHLMTGFSREKRLMIQGNLVFKEERFKTGLASAFKENELIDRNLWKKSLICDKDQMQFI